MVKVKDMYLTWASDQTVCKAGECGGAVTTLLKYALESKMVDGVLAVTKGADLYDGVPTLFTKPEDVIKSAGSLHCAPVQLGKVLVQYLSGAKNMKIAVPVKQCDARSILAAAKRGKVNLDNIIMVGLNCGGTVKPIVGREMIEKYYGIGADDVAKEEIARGKFIVVTKAHEHKEVSIDELEEHGYRRRSNCQRCDIKIPTMADLACGNWGVTGELTGNATFCRSLQREGRKAPGGRNQRQKALHGCPGSEGHRSPGQDQRYHGKDGRKEPEEAVCRSRRPEVLGVPVQQMHQVPGLHG